MHLVTRGAVDLLVAHPAAGFSVTLDNRRVLRDKRFGVRHLIDVTITTEGLLVAAEALGAGIGGNRAVDIGEARSMRDSEPVTSHAEVVVCMACRTGRYVAHAVSALPVRAVGHCKRPGCRHGTVKLPNVAGVA